MLPIRMRDYLSYCSLGLHAMKLALTLKYLNRGNRGHARVFMKAFRNRLRTTIRRSTVLNIYDLSSGESTFGITVTWAAHRVTSDAAASRLSCLVDRSFTGRLIARVECQYRYRGQSV